jgi:hypothetical protein
VIGRDIVERMKYTSAQGSILRPWIEISLELVAADTCVNKIVIALVSACDEGPIMVDCQFPAGVNLRHAAVAAALYITLAHLFMLRVRHFANP